MSHIVELSQPISYAHKGDMQDADFVELIAPNYKQLENFIPVKQAFLAAVTSSANNASAEEVEKAGEEKAKKEEITGNEVMMIMMQSTCDMTKIYLYCAELFKAGAALVGGEQKLTAPMIEAMPLSDFDKLVGEYIANFIATSLMDGM